MSASLKDRRITASQIATLSSLPDAPDTPIAPFHYRIPVEEYLDPARFEAEKRAIFFKDPLVAAMSPELPKPGSFCRQELLGQPVLLTRDKTGRVAAFLNVCKHRGTILCTEQSGSGNLITCPYHAWAYGLDGRLLAVPREGSFDGLDKSRFSLTGLPCVESGGLIWVGLDSKEPADFNDVTGELQEDMSAFGFDRMHIYKKAIYNVRANWKLVMDTMLDTYHVIRLHKNSLARFFVDWPTATNRIGPHLRTAGARGNFTKAAITDDLGAVRDIAVLTYNLFPNAIVTLSPDYMSLAVLRPRAFNHTDVDYVMLADETPGSPEEIDRLERSFALMDRAFAKEDFWAAELGQEGLAAGALSHITLGGMETQMKVFHDIVNERLATRQGP